MEIKDSPTPVRNPPLNPEQVFDTLAAAMIYGYDYAALQLLDYGVDLNIPVYHEGLYRTPPRGSAMGSYMAQASSRPAVEEQNDIIHILLAGGVQCKFYDADIPPHERPHREVEGQVFDKGLGFTPPLVRAVQLRNVEVARLLIAHGADVDAEYHGLESQDDQHIHFVCGRGVQLGIELGPLEMVHFVTV